MTYEAIRTLSNLSFGRLDIFGPSGPNHKVGLVPDPGPTLGTTKFLCEDATFQDVTVVGGAVPTTRLINTTAPLTGGGDLSADRTIALTTPLATMYGGTGTSTVFTQGSVVFAGAAGVYSQDNANFFWDDATNRMGLGTALPATTLDVNGGVTFRSYVDLIDIAHPAAPAAGSIRLHAFDEHGFSHLEEDNEGSVGIILCRDNVFVVRNVSGAPIMHGSPVYVSGATGNTPEVRPAKADSATTMPAIGILIDDIASGAYGQCLKVGLHTGHDTSAFAIGDPLYVSEITAGALTKTRPGYPYYAQRIGTVLVSGVGNGSMAIVTGPNMQGGETGTVSTAYSFAGSFDAAAGKFAVDVNGDITKLKNLTYSWPAAHVAGYLTNDGAGALTWNASAIAGTIIVTDTASATCWPAMFEAATGTIAIHTDGAITYDAATGILTSEISIPVVGSPTINTVNEYRTTVGSSGVIDGTLTYITADPGTGPRSVQVAAGEGFLRIVNDQQGGLRTITWPYTNAGTVAGLTLAVPAAGQETVVFVGIEYNAGSPRVTVRSSFNWNWFDDFPLGRVSYDGATLRILNAMAHAEDTANFARKFNRLTMPFQREEFPEGSGGLEIADIATRQISMTAGNIWHGFNRYILGAVAAGTAFDTHYRRFGGGFVSTTGVTQWPNTQYDDGTGVLATMTNNRYAVLWVYVDVSDGSLDVVYGRDQYTSATLAEAEGVPATVPAHIQYHGRLLGRIIFQKSASSAAAVQSAWVTSFGSSVVQDHNTLSGLQGGTSGEYYHLTSADYTKVTAATALGGFVALQAATPGTQQTGHVNVSGTIVAGDLLTVGTSTPYTGTVATFQRGSDQGIMALVDYNASSGPQFIMKATSAAVGGNAASVAGDWIGFVGGAGNTGAAFTTSRAGIQFETTQNWTGVNNGAAIAFWVTANNTNTFLEKMRLDHNGYLGIGIVSPASLFHVATDTTAVGVTTFQQASADTDSFDVVFEKSRGTVASPTIITTGDELGTIQWLGCTAAGTFVTSAAVKVVSEGTIAATRCPANIEFWTGTDAAPTTLTERMRIDSAGNVGIGTTPSYRLHVSGGDVYIASGALGIGITPDPAFRANITLSIGATGSQAAGVSFTCNRTAAEAVGVTYGLIGGASNTATSGTTASIIGGKIIASGAGNGGTTTALTGLLVDTTVSIGHTVTTQKCIEITNSSAAGSIGTLYGIYIANMSSGSTSYALYSAGGQSYFAGNVGIGTVPSYKLHLAETFGTTGATEYASVFSVTCSAADAAVSRVGLRTTMGMSLTSGSANSIGFYSLIDGSGNGGTTAAARGFASAMSVGTGHTVTDRYAFIVDDATGAGSVTNQYGVYISSLTKGGTLNYAIFTAGATASRFGGDAICDSLFVNQAATSAFPGADANRTWMYRTGAAGGSYPFTEAGHLVLQSRQSDARDILFVGGATAAVKARVTGDGMFGVNCDPSSYISVGGDSNGGQAGIHAATELLTVAAAATSDTVANLLPANAIVLACTCRVTVVIPTATSFTLKSATDGIVYTGNVGVAAGSTDTGVTHWITPSRIQSSAAQKIRLTITGTNPANNSGRVRITVYYIIPTPPTS